MIQWNLLQPVDIGGSIQAGYQLGSETARKERMKGALAAFSADPTNPEAQNALAAYSPEFAMRLAGQRANQAAQQQERQRIGRIASNPDRNAARQEALSQGDLDLAKQISEMEDSDRKAAADRFKAAAPVAYQALKLPYEQRKAYIQTVAPELQSAGWTPQQIEAFDPSDEALTGVVHTNMTLEQAMGRDKINYQEVGPGARLVPFDATGRPVAGTGAPQPVDNTPAPEATPSGEFNYTPVPGAKVTSGYRTPEHNREVGGVPNSYHTRKDANGHPMAYDLVPPPGMSMAELHQKLVGLNPNLDVINEGDHIHVEPKPGRGGGANSDQASIRQHALDAIKAGADPAAVKARAASMGVTL